MCKILNQGTDNCVLNEPLQVLNTRNLKHILLNNAQPFQYGNVTPLEWNCIIPSLTVLNLVLGKHVKSSEQY